MLLVARQDDGGHPALPDLALDPVPAFQRRVEAGDEGRLGHPANMPPDTKKREVPRIPRITSVTEERRASNTPRFREGDGTVLKRNEPAESGFPGAIEYTNMHTPGPKGGPATNEVIAGRHVTQSGRWD